MGNQEHISVVGLDPRDENLSDKTGDEITSDRKLDIAKEYGIDPDEIIVRGSDITIGEPHRKHRENAPIREEDGYGRRSLTQRAVDRAAPQTKEYTIKGRITGFGLRIRPKGSKRFMLVYKISGRMRRQNIGNPCDMTLKQAEAAALDILEKVREDIDPREEKKKRQEFTLNDLFKQYRNEHSLPSHSTSWAKTTKSLYDRHAKSALGNMLVADIDRFVLMRCVMGGSTPNVQYQIRAVLSSMFSYGLAMGYVEFNPLAGARRIVVPKARERFLTDQELSAVWHASFKLNRPWGQIVRCLMMTGQRRSEVSEIHWAEIDLEQKLWTIPARRYKNRRDHIVPLTPLVRGALKMFPDKSGLILGSPRTAGKPVSGFSKMMKELKELSGTSDWRLHDLRRSMASGMARIGVLPHVIEAVLGHRSGIISGIAAVYNRHSYEEEKRAALEQWQNHIFKIIWEFPGVMPNPDDEVEL